MFDKTVYEIGLTEKEWKKAKCIIFCVNMQVEQLIQIWSKTWKFQGDRRIKGAKIQIIDSVSPHESQYILI